MVGYRDEHLHPPWNTFSNTGNVATLHQPTVTVTTVTLTGPTASSSLVLVGGTHAETLQNPLGIIIYKYCAFNVFYETSILLGR